MATAGSAGLGRAARRRQLARWNKNKRRAAVATAVAIVGGGLTVSTMDRYSTDRAQAATAPDAHSMGLAEEQVPESSRQAPVPPADDRTSHTAAKSDPRGVGAARQQPQATPASADPRTARPTPAGPPDARPATAAPVTESQPSAQAAAQPAAQAPAASAPDTSGTATQPSDSPASTDGTAGASQADPAPAPTSPSSLCLLVLCLG
ncbi:hypothetical protein OG342_00520 [Streptomyces bobili]|nr:hypothetical protein [Streptomyces bobili]MCX5521379.1 hypothetical protein [Streptomyces bobili]